MSLGAGRSLGCCALAPAILAIATIPSIAGAATLLEERSSASSVAIELADAPGLLEPSEVLHQSPGETSAFAGLAAAISDGSAHLAAYHIDPQGFPDEQAFALDVPASLGGTLFEPRDVARWDGLGFGSYLDGASVGIPAGVSVDAATKGTDPIVSLDQTVDLGSGVVAHPEDLVELGSPPTLVFDGSAAGVAPGANLNAAHRLPNGNYLLSFDVPLNLGGTLVMPEDMAEWNGSSWELAIDGSLVDAAWSGGDRTGFYAVRLADDDCPDILNPEQTDSDGDAAQDACDAEPGNPLACRDVDLDLCDDCALGTSDPANDGPDNDIDGACDDSDPDDDNDGLLDVVELAGVTDPFKADTDDDDVCDGPLAVGSCTKIEDNCPLAGNFDQANAGLPPEGDACQCGDVDGDGLVEAIDLELARKSLVGATLPPGFDTNRCDVSGIGDPGMCDVSDLYVLERYLNGQGAFQYSCNDYLGP